MKHIGIITSIAFLFSASVSAQEDPAAETEAAQEVETAREVEAPPASEEKERGPYYRKVQGWLWVEAFAGPSSYDPDKFGSLDFGVSAENAPRLKGPEYGFAVGTAFGGPFFLGFFYRQANYDQYKLLKTGLDMQGNLRFIPFVHPILRASIGYAKIFDGSPYTAVSDPDSAGVSFTGGLGVRVPIVRWMSFAATFDWTFVALALRGASGGSTWISGQQFGATFALSFHFIGVRKN